MGRLRLASFTALACLASPALAAEISRVESVDAGGPFAAQVSVRWDRQQERARISRERAAGGAVEDATELRYDRTRNDVVTRLAVALYTGLELHAELPYSLGDDASWRYGTRGGSPVAGGSTIAGNAIDAMGRPCATTPCPLFPVGPGAGVFQGGRAGDLTAGLAWAVFDDRRDDTRPTWVLGLDVTFPTAARYDPALDRDPASWRSPYGSDTQRGPAGEKIWRWDLSTTLSRRLGPLDPYVRAHVTGMARAGDTYSNCEHAAELAVLSPAQATTVAATNCGLPGWKDDAGAQLPFVLGLTFGTELVPFEDRREDQKVSLDLRLWGDYTSRQRFYNELTDASGRLHATGAYLTVGGLVGLYLRASSYVSLRATAGISTRTPHALSGEYLGKRRGEVPAGDVSGATPNPDLNPNYDWRYDAPGSRFRISEVSVFDVSVAGALSF